jgi:hypothetical protein
VERLFNSDVAEIRQRYLFQLANLCGLSPNEVDVLRVADFFQLILGIDQYLAELKRAQDGYDNN